MGVQGLSTLVASYPNIYRDVELKNCRLLVDGYNLLYLMYFSSGLDQNHGGDYAAYEALIQSFVWTLRGCGVEPFVLLDGGTDPSDKKLVTICQRSEDTIQRAQEASQSGISQNILPQMAKIVFRQTLARMRVQLAQCYAEADQELAALAREWEVPILSNDGDFYIFDLPAGFLPLSHFKWKAAAAEAVRTGVPPKSIPCKKYNISSFCTFFGIPRSLLPAFAALAGNDYVKVYSRELRAAWVHRAPAGDGPPSARRLEGGLRWLRAFGSPSEAFQEALRLMVGLDGKQKEEALDGWRLGMEEYQLPPSALSNFFLHNVAPPFLNSGKSPELPNWLQQPLTEARLTAEILDVLQLRRLGMSILVEEGHLPSAHNTSRPLRQLTYGLLLGRNVSIKEKDRVGNELQGIAVPSTTFGAAQQLTLLSLQQAEESQRLRILQEALRLDDDTWASVRRLEDQLRLPLAVTCYWFQQAQPPPDQQVLRALLLLLSLEDGPQTRKALQRRKTEPPQRPDAAVVHTLNQWQSCLKYSIHLNQLLGWPLPEPCVARLFEGTLLHQMIRGLKARKQLRNLTRGGAVRGDLYKRLMATVCQSGASRATPTATAPQSSRARSAPLADDLASSMRRLFVTCGAEDEEEEGTTEQEVDPSHFLRLKNRFVTKTRNNRCSSLELIRKQDLRGRDLV